MHRLFCVCFSVLAATTVLSGPQSQAAVITVPTGLSAGDQYRLVFVTSTTTAATSSDISDYNSFVNTAAANNSDLNAFAWSAIASTSTTAAKDNTGTRTGGDSIGIYNLNGDLLAANYTALWTDPLYILAPVKYNEFGAASTASIFDPPNVWTGSDRFGESGGTSPSGDPLGQTNPMAGFDVYAGQAWLQGSGGGNTELKQLYAMSNVITVGSGTAAVPEPSSFIILALGTGGGWCWRRKRGLTSSAA